MKKRAMALAICVVLCFSIMACGNSSGTTLENSSSANAIEKSEKSTVLSNAQFEEIESAIALYVGNKHPDSSSRYRVGEWDDTLERQSAEVIVTTEYLNYIYSKTLDCTMYWNDEEEQWIVDKGKIVNEEYDFSPLNGTWNAVYSHPSNYLTGNNIPYTFTFSNAGVISVKNNNASSATIKMEHELDQIWKQYGNPEFSDDMPNGVNYESGTVEILCKDVGSHPYFLIIFHETNVDKMFDGECQLRIEENQIIFTDVLVAKDCKLKK